MKNTNNIIYARTRDRKNNPNGIVVALKTKRGQIRFGWSLNNTKAGDVFDMEQGLEIAKKRAIEGSKESIPQSIHNNYTDMVNRGVRYFAKSKSVKVVPV
jgi:hypothetical protein